MTPKQIFDANASRAKRQLKLIESIENAGFSVSGPTDARVAEHGEPAWVCNARQELAELGTADRKEKLVVTTLAGKTIRFYPVPMAVMPSSNPDLWLRFQGRHVIDTALSEETQNAIQRYMKQHKTEALTDGTTFYTLAGGMLAWCNPSIPLSS